MIKPSKQKYDTKDQYQYDKMIKLTSGENSELKLIGPGVNLEIISEDFLNDILSFSVNEAVDFVLAEKQR